MNILLIALYALLLAFLVIYLPFHILQRIRSGEVYLPLTYSYKSVILQSCKFLLGVLVFCLLTYYFSGSLEVTVGLGAFLTACVIGGFLRTLHMEHSIKRRGGEKEDW